jgi:hypothetical protein
MKPALALGPVHWQGEVVGTSGSSTAVACCETHMCVTLVRPCTRICVKMTGFLLGIRGVEDFGKIRRFPIVKQVWTRQTYTSVANRAATDFEETWCERL